IEEDARRAQPPALLWRPPEPAPAVALYQAAPVPPDAVETDHEPSAATLRRALAQSGSAAEVAVSRDDVFSAHGMDSEVDGLFGPAVPLKDGGSLMIEPVAALTAIDVNAGGAPGSTAEDTALKVNLEAAREIPRQIALRRLGGIVAIDFLRMKAARHRREVLATLQRGLESCRIEAPAPGFGRAELVELVLPRRATPLHERLMSPCPKCGGRGDIPDPAGCALALLARIAREGRGAAGPLEARAAPEVIDWLTAREAAVTRELERFAVTGVRWRAEPGWPPDRMDVRPRQD
ncbi:MAG: ribonuclease E/G, partial [Alphaproteobacteria bacterium]